MLGLDTTTLSQTDPVTTHRSLEHQQQQTPPQHSSDLSKLMTDLHQLKEVTNTTLNVLTNTWIQEFKQEYKSLNDAKFKTRMDNLFTKFLTLSYCITGESTNVDLIAEFNKTTSCNYSFFCACPFLIYTFFKFDSGSQVGHV